MGGGGGVGSGGGGSVVEEKEEKNEMQFVQRKLAIVSEKIVPFTV